MYKDINIYNNNNEYCKQVNFSVFNNVEYHYKLGSFLTNLHTWAKCPLELNFNT